MDGGPAARPRRRRHGSRAGRLAASRIQHRRDARRAAEERDRRTRQLAREANAQLLAADEAVREGEQELGFAEAQFRATYVQPFRLALEKGREELHAAFAARQRLDDDIPDNAGERRGCSARSSSAVVLALRILWRLEGRR